MKDRSLIDTINPIFIALTARAIHHCLSASQTMKFWVPPEFGPGGGAQRKCDTRNIKHAVNIACTDLFCRLVPDFRSSSSEVQSNMINTIHSMIHRRIYPTGTDPAMAQPHNNLGSFAEEFLDYVPEELIEPPDNSFNHLSSFVPASEAIMWFSAILPMGGSAIASSSQPVTYSNSNSDSYSNDITSITHMTSVENMGLVDASTILEGARSLGG